MAVFLSRRITRVEEDADVTTVTPGDYTVRVTGLPRAATGPAIRDHFNGLYALNSKRGRACVRVRACS